MRSNDCENLYNNGLKKLITFLFNHPKISFSLYLPGPFIEWLNDKHQEAVIVLSDLISKKQVEIIGGGYYEPIFPLILPVDRIGQIERNTTEIRKQFGKKNRGIFLGDTVWDPVLISGFKYCGMEYAVVNNSLIPEDEPNGKIFVVEDMGKTINIIPYQELNKNDTVDAPQFLLEKIKKYSHLDHTKAYQNDNRIHFSSVSITEIGKIIDSLWLETFADLVEKSPLFEFTIPTTYIKNNTDYIRTFIPAGCPKNIQKWAISPFKSVSTDTKVAKNANIRNFLNTYQEILYLYARMMYSCLIVAQYKGDKVRKKLTRENLWKAQTQDSYLFLGDSGFCNADNRENAYKNILLAEKTVRETTNNITDSLLNFDYDMDGRKEYIVHKENYNAFISLCGGIIFELDLISNSKNYCDTMRRTESYDGINDLYPRKLFVDHLIDFDNFKLFTNEKSYYNTIFSQIIYHETNYNRVRKELVLTANAQYGILQQPVSLKKKFLFTDDGIKVQYIIKNESPLPLKCYFAVESNLCFNGTDESEQIIEVIYSGNRERILADKTSVIENEVSIASFKDVKNNNNFVFETNENAGIIIQPLYITRPINSVIEKRYQATTGSFFWKIDIPPGYEFEKTLFLGIVPVRKNTKSKNK
ncbi:MAG: alpha-amylase/4-alpha-glucanotransferase domain-containing protein [Treponemataceae bacterium]